MFKEAKLMDMVLDKCLFQNRFYYFQRFPYFQLHDVVSIHWNCLIEAIPRCTYNICPFNK